MTVTQTPEVRRTACGAVKAGNQIFRPPRVLQQFEDWLFGYDFFISYRWSDGRRYAEALARSLGRRYSCFLDSAEYAGGDNIVEIGNRALRHTERLILVATHGVAESVHVKRELKIYRESHKHVLAIDFAGSIAHLRERDSEISDLLADNELFLSEEGGRKPDDGPSDSVINEISRSLSVETKRFRRQRAITAALASFVILGLLFALLAILVRQMAQYESARRQLLTAFSAQVRGIEEGQLHITIDYQTQNRSQGSRTVDVESLVLASNTIGTTRSLNLLNCKLNNIHALALSTDLRHLNLFKSTGVTTLGFLEQMPELEILQLDETGITDELLSSVILPCSTKELKLSNNFHLTSASVSSVIGNLKAIELLSLFGCSNVALSQADVDNLLRHAEQLKRLGKVFHVNLNGVDLSRVNAEELQYKVEKNNFEFLGITPNSGPLT